MERKIEKEERYCERGREEDIRVLNGPNTSDSSREQADQPL
jgi:hypothetical protein